MNILTIDLEDWFHILDFEDTAFPVQWGKYESRIEKNTERILDLLDKHKLTATFFCLGWIAKRYPELIRKISVKHEIACHSMDHQLLYLQSKDAFKRDLNKCVSLLENTTGKKVVAYRAPGFSFSRNHDYVLEELNRLEIKIDCSVFPVERNHGGIGDFPIQKPCMLYSNNFEIVEFPLNTALVFSKPIVFSGGGYFRFLPYPMIKNWMKQTDYVMTYFHPRDFDPGQPRLHNLPLKRRIMSYTGLDTSFVKLDKLFCDFKFVSLLKAYNSLDLALLPKVKL